MRTYSARTTARPRPRSTPRSRDREGGALMAKKTPAQLFAAIFARFTAGSTPDERATAEKAMDAWLKKRGKSRIDIQVILHQASLDDAAAAPPPPPSDPRDTQAHPFEDPRLTPAGLVHGIAGKYLAMTSHAAVIYALWICFTHVHTQFRIAPRVAHGLAILDALGLDQIGSVRFNKELRQLDLPDARWARFSGPSGLSYDPPIHPSKPAQPLSLLGIQ